MAATVDRKQLAAELRQLDKRRSRPLTAQQERLFFGIVIAAALLVQIAVVWMPAIASR